jgi:hypothetical protein
MLGTLKMLSSSVAQDSILVLDGKLLNANLESWATGWFVSI